jgi:hypothetical protein
MRLRQQGIVVFTLLLVSVACGSRENDDPAGEDTPAPSDSASGSSVGSGATIRVDGVAELRLGQTPEDAAATGLVGIPSEEACDYRHPDSGEVIFTVAELQGGLEGLAIFESGALYRIRVTSGAQTELGLGPSDSLHDLSRLYRAPEYVISLDPILSETMGAQVLVVERDGEGIFSVVADAGEDIINEIWITYTWACGGV